MRTTLNLPDKLVTEAMAITNISLKSQLMVTALENLIQREKVKGIKKYAGKMDLAIDLAKMRAR
ncbi:hypothetical protein FACS1894139_09050 [Planctomycetales bacterium]|nr:hypothetical protein FACS1894107_11900 [Planctomycetales bacterium]GHS98123.1 hypothetical protein FACS1894108_05700 [Planctomycetales bacterium]GHT05363.1 hypothetical protein FACS1894139_09050 [Planctomycetales bacterium]